MKGLGRGLPAHVRAALVALLLMVCVPVVLAVGLGSALPLLRKVVCRRFAGRSATVRAYARWSYCRLATPLWYSHQAERRYTGRTA